jgi:uncharacterized protein (TIGR02646 family)
MKRCVKSQPEPAILASYRSGSPNSTWDQMKNESPACYSSLRERLGQDQGGLCAYCEMILTTDNTQVAHFHPKSDTNGANNWALDWDNLWLACKGGSQSWMRDENCFCPPLPDNLSCDERKGGKVLDDDVFAPNEIPAYPRVFSYHQQPDRIEIRPDQDMCEGAGIPVEKVQRTIDEFNLNCGRLVSARLALHRQLEQAIKRLRESGMDPQQGFASLVKKHLSKDTNGRWQRFLTLVRWRFGKAAEDHLQAIGYEG